MSLSIVTFNLIVAKLKKNQVFGGPWYQRTTNFYLATNIKAKLDLTYGNNKLHGTTASNVKLVLNKAIIIMLNYYAPSTQQQSKLNLGYPQYK